MTDRDLLVTETSTEAAAAARTTSGVERICPKCERSFAEDLERCPDDETLLIIVGEEVDPLVGKTIRDTLTLRERIGKGGMGVVYTAWQHSVGREVAVKVMSARINRDADAAKRFIREANLASKLSHPNIVTIHDFGQDEDRLLYIVMEYLTGVSLREALQSGETFTLEQVHRMATQLCDALEAAHAATIVHRDLKPANIMLLRKVGVRDFLKVLDFGIAKSLDGSHTTITQSNAILGTPAYLAPEVALTSTFDARSDLYSLGVILYQLMAGRLPFQAENVRAMVAMHASEPVPPLPEHVPTSVAKVVNRLLEKDPADRYESAAAVREALTQAMRGLPSYGIPSPGEDDGMQPTIPATPEALVRQAAADRSPRGDGASAPAATRSRGWLAAAVITAVAAAGFAAFLLGRDKSTPRQATTDPRAAIVADAGMAAATARRVVADAGPADAAVATTIRVVVKAPRARIFVNGRPLGQSPVDTRLPRGKEPYYLRVVRRGYREWTGTFASDKDRTHTPKLVKIRTRKAKPEPPGPFLPPQ